MLSEIARDYLFSNPLYIKLLLILASFFLISVSCPHSCKLNLKFHNLHSGDIISCTVFQIIDKDKCKKSTQTGNVLLNSWMLYDEVIEGKYCIYYFITQVNWVVGRKIKTWQLSDMRTSIPRIPQLAILKIGPRFLKMPGSR